MMENYAHFSIESYTQTNTTKDQLINEKENLLWNWKTDRLLLEYPNAMYSASDWNIGIEFIFHIKKKQIQWLKS